MSASENGVSPTARANRSRTVSVAPGASSRTTCAAAFVPVPAGSTASARPSTIAAWKASFTNGVALGVPKSRSVFVSLPVNSHGASRSMASR